MENMKRLASRQVHLDFHTSEKIPGVGSKFDKEAFQAALKAGHINSMTVFGKCHHGYFYYPTEVGTIHPTMDSNQDLSKQMMDACHEIGVRAPLYLTWGWSALDAKEHPEWVAKAKDGSFMGIHYDMEAAPTEERLEVSWLHLCSAGGYRQYLYNMVEEACKRYQELDGIFLDIVFTYNTCYCDHCRKGMMEMGIDIDNVEEVKKYYELQKHTTLQGVRDILESYHKDATLFYNSGGADIHRPQWHYINTHYELEDLPTTWGGYDKMPIRAKYFARSGKDFLGMTGKFHRSWGEFGGFKTPEALKYECGSLLASGARISVGDQMHPHGYLDMETYKNIGVAFSYVEKVEKYCYDVKETSRLGVMINEDEKTCEAMSTLLSDCHLDFDVVHDEVDLLHFDTVIIPDNYVLSESYGKAIDTFVKYGGKVLLLGGSGVNEAGDGFGFDCPFTYQGKSDFDKDYIKVTESIEKNMVTSPILCYSSAYKVAGEGTVLSHVYEPFFSRTYEHYCSHYNTPYGEEKAAYPGAIQNGNIIYIAHPIATLYKEFGSSYHRRYFKNILDLLYKENRIDIKLPVQGRVHLLEQEAKKRYVLHVLYGSPVQRGGVCVIEDLPELTNINTKVMVEEEIKKVKLVPQNIELVFSQEGKEIEFTIPKFSSHQMVVFEY